MVHSVDPYTRKEWYDVKAPSYFDVRNVGKTLVNRTAGTSTIRILDALSQLLELCI